MKQSCFEKEVTEIYELLEEISSFDKRILSLKEDDLITELEKIKYMYFKKGYLAHILVEE